MNKITLVICLNILLGFTSKIWAQTASFNAPDTVCRGQNITITNTSTGQTTNLWNFCKQAPTGTISGTNLGNSFMPIRPTFLDIQKDGSNYVAIVGNDNFGSQFYRLNFGNSPLNTPVATNLGTFGGILVQTDGVKLINDNGNWYCFVCANNNSSGNHKFVRLDFGNSLLNTPTLVNFGNLNGVLSDFQTDLDILKTSNGYVGFIGLNNGQLLRINLGSSITNTPIAQNLGAIGGQTRISAFGLVYRNNNYYLFMPNDGWQTNNYFINRLNFGNSLLNTPTSTNLGNPGNLLNRAYDFLPFTDCDNFKGYVLSPGNNSIIEYTFPNDVASNTITGVNLGNIGLFSFPASFSNEVVFNNEKYVFLTNSGDNTLSRLKLSTSCNTFGVPSSTITNPSIFHIDSVGTYNVSLTINQNLSTEARTCQEIVVVDSIKNQMPVSIPFLVLPIPFVYLLPIQSKG